MSTNLLLVPLLLAILCPWATVALLVVAVARVNEVQIRKGRQAPRPGATLLPSLYETGHYYTPETPETPDEHTEEIGSR